MKGYILYLRPIAAGVRFAAMMVFFSVWMFHQSFASAATFTVTSTADTGAVGTLRWAITNANAMPGADTIAFQITGSGVHTIAPSSALPALTDAVIIDGATQLGYSGQPLIELSGSSAGSSSSGLRLAAGNSTVRALAINRFRANGIDITSDTNVVEGNYIGCDAAGVLARGNVYEGIWISGSAGNTIGGTNALSRNLISGNGDAGIYLQNATENRILGNYIGTTVTGNARLGNTNNGVVVYNSTVNVIGGTNTASRNIISGNHASGVYLFGSGSYNNAIQGNYIGTTVSGNVALPNAGDGVTLSSAILNVIGGTIAGSGNLISGNSEAGVAMGYGASGNLVQGNFIGTDISGSVALGNTLAGVTIYGSGGNLVGGIVSGAGNVISGNSQDGVFVFTNDVGNTIAGNFIGLSAGGTTALPNLFNGITFSNASANTVGGTTGNPRNIISGNANYGIQISAGGTSNLVQGNFIGTDPAGNASKANSLSGIRIEGSCNTVGTAGAGNLISGNGQDGVFIVGSMASSNTVQGNYIGTTAAGTSNLGNGRAGVGISGAEANSIGNPGAGNLISGNGDAGIYLIATGASRNRISANTIGANAAGTSPLGNTFEGVYLERAGTNFIGGLPPLGAGNLISGNSTRGIFLTNAAWNVIQANFIGTAGDGVSPLPNIFHGIECERRAHDNLIGGSVGAGNRIAFASVGFSSVYAGVRIRAFSTNNAVLGNSIFSNGALGIDLGNAGIDANDSCDSDTGANMQQNYPILTQAAIGGGGVGARGIINSRAGTTFRIQVFASPTCDPSGNGEGQIYMGEKFVTTSGACTADFVAAFAGSVPDGYYVTTTATDSSNNTSEFSPCLVGEPTPRLFVSDGLGQVNIAWTNTTTGYVLKQTDNLLPPVEWTTVTNVPVNLAGNFVVTLPVLTTSNRFFALSFE